MGNSLPIGTAYRDQDLDGSTITNSQFSGTLNPFGGKVWYADSSGPGYDGSSWAKAFKTIGAAVAQAVSGDIVAIRGSFIETVTMSAAGVTIMGVGTGPKLAQWTSATDTATCTIAATARTTGMSIRSHWTERQPRVWSTTALSASPAKEWWDGPAAAAMS